MGTRERRWRSMRRRAATLARECHAAARAPGDRRALVGRGLLLLAGLLYALVAAATGRGGNDALLAHAGMPHAERALSPRRGY